MAQVQAAPATRFATVNRIQGEITAVTADTGAVRVLRQNDAVYVGERIRAAASSEAVLKTDDAGFIALRPRAEFVAEQYAAEGRPTDHLSLRLVKGGLRMITGWIGRVNRPQYRVQTLTATIGIRGTDHEPYEMSDDLADLHGRQEGTYDKVNRGGTTMDVRGRTLDIDPGKVGFVRAPPKSGMRSRGLLTVTLPVLLEKVPDFYVPGQFDDELDRLSRTTEDDAMREFASRGGKPAQAPTPAPVSRPAPKSRPAPATGTAPPAAAPATAAQAGECAFDAVARQWLRDFDAAVARRDAPAVIRQFAFDVVVRVTVRNTDGQQSTVEMGRDELARSTIAAVSGLTDYSQRRPSVESRLAETAAGACDQITIRSTVIEQGRQSGRPYRFEALEEYLLVRRDSRWLAIKGEATQR